MKYFYISLNIILLSLLTIDLFCFDSLPDKEKVISIPASGNSWVINNVALSSFVINTSGITNWTDSSAHIRTYFRLEQTGAVNIGVRAKVKSGSSTFIVKSGGKQIRLTLGNTLFDTVNIGTFTIDKPGYQWIEFEGISKTSSSFAEISDIFISGPATEGKVYFIKDDFYFGRRGPSVHLKYQIPAQASDIEWFYNEITIPEGNDVIGSYYMADGFAEGYFGIQVNSSSERRILFSVWSPYKTDKPGDIPEEYKIILLKKGPDVVTKEFGNEGSGGQSYRIFPWKTGTTYRFLLHGHPSVNNSTDYTAYFFAPETGQWQLIASFRRPKTKSYLKNLYSFLENFIPETGSVTRKGFYANQWIYDTNGKWYELTTSKFTADATARKESRLDYSGGVENGIFFLRNCGFFSDKSEIDSLFSRPATGSHPAIDFSLLK